jgi:putative ABC transport system substrate-binding protein
MQRRGFITLLGGAAVAWPIATRAQQPAKMKRIALVDPAAKVGDITVGGPWWYRVFFEELSRLGYVEGRSLLVDRYPGEGRTEHYAELIRDVVNAHPDLIFATNGFLALLCKAATTTIPILTISANPVGIGLVPSIARPGGNITGVAIDGGFEIYGKRIGLLIEAISKPSNVGYIASRGYWERPIGAAVREAASRAKISLTGELLVSFNEQEYQRVFNSMERDRTDALIFSEEGEHLQYLNTIVELAAKSRIPAIYCFRDFVEAGGLMSYSTDLEKIMRREANLIDQILKGTKPGDIPFYQETKFELAINLKTAKALGLEMPATLVGRADEVIE